MAKLLAFPPNITLSYYQPYKDQIYSSTVLPSGDLRVATPPDPVGWSRAETIRNKHYFDEILFYAHLYVTNEQAIGLLVDVSKWRQHMYSIE